MHDDIELFTRSLVVLVGSFREKSLRSKDETLADRKFVIAEIGRNCDYIGASVSDITGDRFSTRPSPCHSSSTGIEFRA